MYEYRRIYESYLEAQLARWKADLQHLKSKDGHAKIDVMAHHEESIKALQQKHDEASFHLSSLRGASDEAWESVKASTESNWMKFKSAFQGSAASPHSDSSRSEEQFGLSPSE